MKIMKSPGMDLITIKMLKKLPQKGNLYRNAIIRMQYWLEKPKIAEIILIPKLLQKIMFKRTDPEFTSNDWVPHYQFG